MNIAVFGLGYVGMVNIACLSKLGNRVIGCDIKQQKVELVNSGKSTIVEPELDELLDTAFKKGLISGNSNAEKCIKVTDVAIICVGTPSDSAGQVNMNYILNTSIEIARIVKNTQKKYTVIYRSTIPPGSMDNMIRPHYSEVLGQKTDLVTLVFMPEFLREGNAVKDFFYGARIVVGLNESRDGEKTLSELFGFSKEVPIMYTDYKTAEFVKYVDNAFHATKVAFVNEMYALGSYFEVDTKKANELFLMDKSLNVSEKYLRPGSPFGGSCLPKDTRAILRLGELASMEMPFIKGVIESNKQHQHRLFSLVMSFGKKRILLYGLTFKKHTDDIRESPYLNLLRAIAETHGLEVKVYDPNLNISNLRVEFPDVVRHIELSEEVALNWAELIVQSQGSLVELSSKVNENKYILNCMDNEDYLRKNIVNLF